MGDAYCSDCKRNTEVVFDHAAGDTVCSDCGLVLESHSIDETSEWRTFANESGDHDPVRVGGPSNPLLADAALTTVIAGPRGDALPSSLGRWQNRASNPERSLILAFKTIATMSESILITSVLKACAARLDLGLGRRIHASLIQSTLHFDPFIVAFLITIYSKCGSIADAHKVFDQLSHRDPTVWNAILTAHFHHAA